MSDTYSYEDEPEQSFDPVDFVKAQQRATVANVISSLDDNPDEAVRARDIGGDLGIPPVVVHKNLDLYEKQHKAALTAQLLQNNKFLAQHAASNPLAASVSNDDWGQLDQVSNNLHKLGTISTMAEAIKGFKEGWSSTGDIGEWLHKMPGGPEYLARYPYSARLLQFEGLAVELPMKIFSGLVQAGLSGVEEIYKQQGGDESGARRFAQAIVGPIEHHIISGGSGMDLPPPQIGADFIHAKRLMEYIVRGQNPPVGVSHFYDAMKFEEAKRDLAAFKEVSSSVDKTNTKERSADDTASFIRQQTGDATVGIDASAVRQLYGNKLPEIDDGLLGWIPDINEQLRMAEQTGGDIVVPMADWLARTEGEVKNKLHNFIRVRPDSVNIEETKFFKEHETAMKDQPMPLESGDTALDAVRAQGGMESPFDLDRLKKVTLEPKDVKEFEPREWLEGGFGPEDAKGIHSFEIKGPDGRRIGDLSVAVLGDGNLFMNWIHAGEPMGPKGFEKVTATPNYLGPRVMRDILAQLKQQFPNAEKVTGIRVSGARKGPAKAAGQRSREMSLPLHAPTPDGLERAAFYINTIASERSLIPPTADLTPRTVSTYYGEFNSYASFKARDVIDMVNSNPDQYIGALPKTLYKFFGDRLKEMAGDVDIAVISKNELNEKKPLTGGWYEPRAHKVYIPTTSLDGTFGRYYPPSTVIHELTHAATHRALMSDQILHNNFTMLLKEAKEYMDKNLPEQRKEFSYALSAPTEFLAESWSRQDLQQTLSHVPISKELAAALGLEKPGNTVWDAIRKMVSDLLEKIIGTRPSPSILDGILKASERFEDLHAQYPELRQEGYSGIVKAAFAPREVEAPRVHPERRLPAEEPVQAPPEKPPIGERAPFAKGAAIGMPEKNYRKVLDLIRQRFNNDLMVNQKRYEALEAKRQSKEWKENAAAMRPEVEERLLQRPDIAADQFFSRGMLHGYRVPGGLPKLARDALTEEQRARLSKKYISEEGFNPNEIAGTFGYQSGDALVERLGMLQDAKKQLDLEGKPFLNKLIDDELQRKMEEKYGRLTENVFQDAKDQASSQTQLDLIHEEMLGIAQSVTGAEISLTKEQLEQGLIESFKGSSLRQVGSDSFLRDAGRAAKKAEFELLVNNDPAEFLKAKQAQYKATFLAKQAVKLEKEVEKAEKLLKRWSIRSDPKVIDQEFLDWAHSIMFRIDRAPKRTWDDLQAEIASEGHNTKTLADFVQSNEGFGLRELQGLPDWLIDPTFTGKLEDLTVDQFRQVHDALQNLVHVGKGETKARRAGEEAARQKIKDEMLANIQTMAPKLYDAKGERWLTPFIPPKQANEIRNYGYSHLQMETIFNRIDKGNPFGVMTQYMFRDLADSATTERKLERDYSKMILALKDEKLDRKKLIDNPFIMDPYSMQRSKQGYGDPVPLKLNIENIRAIILNMGNKSNREKFLRGYEIPEESWPAFDSWLHSVSTREDWLWAQRYGDVFKDFKTNHADPLYRRLNGIAPEELDIKTFANPHGSFRGWYYPIIYSALHEGNSKRLMGGDALEGEHYTRATTPNGYIERRTGYNAPIDLSLDRGVTRLKQEIHDVAFREAIIEASKFYYDKEVRSAIAHHYGKEARDMLVPYLKDVANSSNVKNELSVASGGLSEAFRQNLIGVLIGWNPATVAKHGLTALWQSGHEVGWKELGEAYSSLFSRDDATGESNWQFALRMSQELASRHRNYMEVMRGGSENLFKKFTLRDVMLYSGAYFVSRSDLFSAVPAWLAQYKKTLTETGNVGDAVYAADRAVRRAHGSTALTSRPAIVRQGNMWMTSLYGFFNHIMNRQYEIAWRAADAMDNRAQRLLPGESKQVKLVRQADGTYIPEKAKHGAAAIPGLAASLVAYLLVPAIIEEMVSPLDHDEDEDFLKTAGKGLLKTSSSSWVYGRDIGQAIVSGKDPSAGLISTGYKQFTDMIRDMKKEDALSEDNAGAVLQHTINLFGAVTGLANGEMGRRTRMMQEMMTDKMKSPETPEEWWNVLLHSTPEYPRRR